MRGHAFFWCQCPGMSRLHFEMFSPDLKHMNHWISFASWHDLDTGSGRVYFFPRENMIIHAPCSQESKSQGCTYKILWSAAAGLKIQIGQVANMSELASHTCFWLRGWVRSHQLKWKIKEIANGPHSAPPPTIPSLFDTLKLAYGAH